MDPLHQLILLFSRTALTEKWYCRGGARGTRGGQGKEPSSESRVRVSVCPSHLVLVRRKSLGDTTGLARGGAFPELQALLSALVFLNLTIS